MKVNSIKTAVAVLGGGPAGYVAALRAAQLGADVVLIDEKELGGVCMNVGCIPTKALLKSAETASVVNQAREFGFDSTISVVNWNTAVERKNRIIKNLNTGLTQLISAKRITLLSGHGTVKSANEILVTRADEKITVVCEKMILTTGSTPFLPPIEGIDSEGVVTSTQALELTQLPSHVIIIGAGVIGVEFATMFKSAGVKVTVIELGERIIPSEDQEISTELLKILKRQGIVFKLSAKVTSIQAKDDVLTVTYEAKGKQVTVTGDKVLVAVGRSLTSEAFSDLPVRIEKGAVVTNNHMQTSIEGVYAAGDIVGGKLLAHLAFIEGKVAAENALGINNTVNYNAVPACVYTSPEVASVGMTEEEAQKAGIQTKIGKFEFRHNGRALTSGQREGFVKIVCAEDNTIIGAQILGANASEMISELTLAITLKAKTDIIADMIHPHPSLNEAIWEACGDVLGRSIHSV